MEKRTEWKTLPVMTAVFLLILSLITMVSAAFVIEYISDLFESVESAIYVKEEKTQKRWNSLIQLNVFDDLSNAVLKPGNSGSYGFEVHNNAEYPIYYELNITDKNIAKVPMQFRLKDGAGNFLVGSEKIWVAISELSKIPGTLDYKDFDTYILDWLWDGTNNTVDTNAGIIAQNKVLYILNFELIAEQNGAPMNSLIDPAPQLNNLAFWLTILIIAVMVGGEVLVWYLVWRKDKEKSQ